MTMMLIRLKQQHQTSTCMSYSSALQCAFVADEFILQDNNKTTWMFVVQVLESGICVCLR